MNKYLLIIGFWLLSACGQPIQIVHYEYGGAKINRLNKGDKVFFSYGYSNDDEKIMKDASVVVDYSFDNILFGFLLFHKNGTIEIISGGGGDYKMIKDNKIFYQKDSSSKLDPFKKGNYDSLYQISDNLELERNRNKSFGSRVRIIH